MSDTAAAQIYSAVYSGVSVFEMNARGIAVMRRRSDSYLNATQILKVAGIEKGKRTKILEREVLIGEHEKVQGGYGKYQGTWIPFEKGKELAERYEVAQYLIPIFEYDPAEHQDESGEDITPTKDEAMGIRKPNTSKSTITKKLVSSPHGHSQDSRSQEYPLSSPHRTAGTDTPARASSPMYRSYSNIEEPLRKRLKAMSPFESPSRTYTYDSQQEEDHDTPGERHRAVLMSLFLNEDPDHIPDLFLQHNTPKDLNIELVIDDQGHTALHWAAALARLKTLRQLVERGADIQRTNFAGETALMRSVLVTNNYGQQCFSDLLDILFESINSVDQQKRTVLHHMALTAGIPRRATACSYYMNILIQRVQEKLTEDEKSRLLEARDNNGDTALNIAARLGNRKMMITLIKAGADRYAANNVGLKPEDFVNDFKNGDSDLDIELFNNSQLSGTDSLFSRIDNTQHDTLDTSLSFPTPSKRSREIISAVQKIVNDLDAEYTGELSLKQQEIRESREELKILQTQLEEAQQTTATFKDQALKLEEAEKRIKMLEGALNGRDGGLLHFDSYGGNIVEDTNSVLNVLNEEQRSDSQMLMSNPDTEKENVSDNGTNTPTNGALRRSLLQSPRPSNQSLSNGNASDTVQQQESKIQQLQLKINSCTKSEMELKKQLEELNAKSSEKEMQYKKLIAVCCGITLERVDDLLQPLIQAVECEQMANLDIGKVEDFMATVQNDVGDTTAMAIDDVTTTMTMGDTIGQQQQ
ncbi:hypothetical protein BGW37DRAFT_478221 [Umbelopsis sp. PMI_123]|nr:hypothetical protein BGW37DRAFT_478221 [Umbelopsis sp. PMI_123]